MRTTLDIADDVLQAQPQAPRKGASSRANSGLRASCQSFGAANDRLESFKGAARIPSLKTINPLAAQSRYALVPREEHSLTDIFESSVSSHRFSHTWRDLRDRVTNRFDDFDLCFDGNAERGGDELSETLTRTPGFLAHKADPGRILLVSSVRDRCNHIVRRRKANISPRRIEQREILRVTIGVA
jgi:hypothetical protein